MRSKERGVLVGLLALAVVAVLAYPPHPAPNAGTSPPAQTATQASPDVPTEPSKPATASPSLQSARVVRAVDGDTLVVDVEGVQDKVRLIGVDAPESVHPDKSRNTPAGIAASDYMKTLAAPGQVVWLQKDVSETDRYGRLLRYVWLDAPADAYSADEVKAKMLNARIEESGHARAMTMPPDTAYSKEFERMEGRMAF